jgi:hypothetical protein
MESGEVLRCLACKGIVRAEDCEPFWAWCCDVCGHVEAAIDSGVMYREAGDVA